MATVTAVNIKLPPYSDRLKTVGNIAKSGRIAWVNKDLADTLLSIAKSENADIYVNSTMRSSKQNDVNGYGTAHIDGRSVDLNAVVKRNAAGDSAAEYKRLSGDATARKSTVVRTITKYSNGDKPLLDSGAHLFLDKSQDKLSIANEDGKKVDPKSKIIANYSFNRGEAMHVQDVNFQADRKSGADNALGKLYASSSSLDAGGYYKDNENSQAAMMTVEVNDLGYPVDGAKVDFTYKKDLKNGTIGAGKVTITDKNKLKDIDIATSKVEVVNADGDVVPLVPNVKNAGDTTDGMKARTTYTSNPHATYIKKTSYTLPNDSRAISSEDLSLKGGMEDKRIKNAIGCRNPFGTLEKYRISEQPASLRLILDKLFENERSKEAINKWTAYEDAKVTYIDQFIMERVSTQRKENYRVIASLGEEYKVYFGTSSPEVLSITGYTLNTVNQQWLYDFRYFYENYLRGSRLVENRLRAFLTFTDSIFEVLPVSFAYSESAKIPGAVTLSIDCVVLQWIPFGGYTDPLTRNKTKATAEAPIFSPAQLDFSNQTLGILSKMQEDYKQTAGLNDLQRYAQLWSQQALVSVPNGIYGLPFFTKPNPSSKEKVNLDATPTTEAYPWLAEQLPSIYATQRNQVDIAGLNTTKSVSPAEIISANRVGPLADKDKTNIKNTVSNNFNKGHNLSS